MTFAIHRWMSRRSRGKLPMVSVAAAAANAVYRATGVRVRELPIRLDKLLMA